MGVVGHGKNYMRVKLGVGIMEKNNNLLEWDKFVVIHFRFGAYGRFGCLIGDDIIHSFISLILIGSGHSLSSVFFLSKFVGSEFGGRGSGDRRGRYINGNSFGINN